MTLHIDHPKPLPKDPRDGSRQLSVQERHGLTLLLTKKRRALATGKGHMSWKRILDRGRTRHRLSETTIRRYCGFDPVYETTLDKLADIFEIDGGWAGMLNEARQEAYEAGIFKNPPMNILPEEQLTLFSSPMESE